MLPSQIKLDVYGGGVGKILDGGSCPHPMLTEAVLLEGEVTGDSQGQRSWAFMLLGIMLLCFPRLC